MTQFLMGDLSADDRYKLLTGSITPRPIAWVTSLSRAGVLNAAPYSFFNVLAAEPPLIVLGLMRKPDGSFKDTCRNIVETGEFVINLVTLADLDAMNLTSIDAPETCSETELAAIATLPSTLVGAPRIASSPVNLECRLFQRIDASPASTIILGEVVALHVADEFVSAEKHIDAPALNLIARMHGRGWYATEPALVQRTRPTFATWSGRTPDLGPGAQKAAAIRPAKVRGEESS